MALMFIKCTRILNPWQSTEHPQQVSIQILINFFQDVVLKRIATLEHIY